MRWLLRAGSTSGSDAACGSKAPVRSVPRARSPKGAASTRDRHRVPHTQGSEARGSGPTVVRTAGGPGLPPKPIHPGSRRLRALLLRPGALGSGKSVAAGNSGTPSSPRNSLVAVLAFHNVTLPERTVATSPAKQDGRWAHCRAAAERGSRNIPARHASRTTATRGCRERTLRRHSRPRARVRESP